MLERHRLGARVAAARWFGASIAATPVADVLGDAGWFTVLAGVSHGIELPPAWRSSLLWSAGFVALAVAGAAIMHRLSRRDARWFFAVSAVPTAMYALGQGVRPASIVGLGVLCLAGLRVFAIDDAPNADG